MGTRSEIEEKKKAKPPLEPAKQVKGGVIVMTKSSHNMGGYTSQSHQGLCKQVHDPDGPLIHYAG